eukprot:2204465-Pleurochrysis_carterae.AAC.2
MDFCHYWMDSHRIRATTSSPASTPAIDWAAWKAIGRVQAPRCALGCECSASQSKGQLQREGHARLV